MAENRCWGCGLTFQCNRDLQNHLHDVVDLNELKTRWSDDRYLIPFMQDDSLLYSFGECDEGGEDEQIIPIDEDLIKDLMNIDENIRDGQGAVNKLVVDDDKHDAGRNKVVSVSNDHLSRVSSSIKELINGKDSRGHTSNSDKDPEERHLMVNSHNHIAKHIKKVNESYFGSYSSFGIHREMLSDKV